MPALNKSGVRFPVELSILPVEQENERSFCAFIRDITERKKAEITLKERSEQLQELSRHLQRVRENERSIIAREIHDELGQQLTALKMDVMWLKKRTVDADETVSEKFRDAISLIDDTVKSIRRIVTELRPSIIDDLGLNAALEWQVHDFADRMSMDFEYENSFDDDNIDPVISIGLFRILQESLTNIAKHALANKITVSIHQLNDAVELSVADDGVGFDTDMKQTELTFGLLGIKERTDMMQGTCIITSKSGKGTCVVVTIPLG
jgi:signal transduction histidine kinase